MNASAFNLPRYMITEEILEESQTLDRHSFVRREQTSMAITANFKTIDLPEPEITEHPSPIKKSKKKNSKLKKSKKAESR